MVNEKLPAAQLPPREMGTVEVRDSYSVEFVEYGQPVVITAPSNPVKVAGKG